MPDSIAAIFSAIVNFTLVRHPILILTVILAFTTWCFIVDADIFSHIDGHSLFLAICRICAKNVKLAWKLFVGLLFLIAVVGLVIKFLQPRGKVPSSVPSSDGGPESEKFYRFMNATAAPLQWMVDGVRFILGVLAIIFLVTLYCAGKVLAFSPIVTLAVITLVYLYWLWITTRKIVEEQYGEEATVAHAVLALVPAELGTWIIVILSIVSIYGAVAWIGQQIPD